MGIAKQNKVIIAAGTSSAPGATTKTAPSVTGTAIDCNTFYGGELNYRITNGTAPNPAVTLTFQVSPDNAVWYDYYTVGGDTTTGTTYSGSIALDRGVMWVRAIAYGNQTNPVTVEATLQAITGV
jgi:hypothetical protein